MKEIFQILLLLVLINFCISNTFLIIDTIHPDHQDQCYDQKTKHTFSPGETYTPFDTRCIKMTCLSPGKINVTSCNLLPSPPNCDENLIDMTRPYPDCCMKYLCVDENGNKYLYDT